MTPQEMEDLKIGDRVEFTSDILMKGAVKEIGYTGVKVLWDDGVWSMIYRHEAPLLTKVRT